MKRLIFDAVELLHIASQKVIVAKPAKMAKVILDGEAIFLIIWIVMLEQTASCLTTGTWQYTAAAADPLPVARRARALAALLCRCLAGLMSVSNY